MDAINDSRLKFTPSQGTYFQLLDYSAVTDEGDEDFAKRLITDYQLASIPISSFNVGDRNDNVLRFCFAKKQETLEKAAIILNRL